MNIPEWLKPGLIGVVSGGVIVAVAGFAWGGWMTSSSADQMARVMANNSVIAALLPVCVNLSTTDPDRVEKLATISQATSFGRRDAMLAAGWATIPGDTAASRRLATACVEALDLPPA